MATIKAIEPTTVHRIQAGQVIVDLCSVVKELVENCLDAGASVVDVRFKNQGLECVEVQDNGTGISPENYETVALKHYTSKLAILSDMDTLKTFGFRGEALSSLSGLSHLSITTCMATDAPKATKLDFEPSGRLAGTSVVAGQKGTIVMVQNLFHNLPVRRRELERNIKREWSKTVSLLNQYACIQTGVKFTVSQQPSKGKRIVLFTTKGNTTTRENIINIFGTKTIAALLELDVYLDLQATLAPQLGQLRTASTRVHVQGFISRPVHGEGRQTPDRQMLFVNGRPCAMPQFSRIFNEVYRSYNPSQSPFVLADIRLDTHLYDVNVSPDKRTILMHEQGVMLEELRGALLQLFEEQDYSVPKSQLSKPALVSNTVPETKSAYQASKPAGVGRSGHRCDEGGETSSMEAAEEDVSMSEFRANQPRARVSNITQAPTLNLLLTTKSIPGRCHSGSFMDRWMATGSDLLEPSPSLLQDEPDATRITWTRANSPSIPVEVDELSESDGDGHSRFPDLIRAEVVHNTTSSSMDDASDEPEEDHIGSSQELSSMIPSPHLTQLSIPQAQLSPGSHVTGGALDSPTGQAHNSTRSGPTAAICEETSRESSTATRGFKTSTDAHQVAEEGFITALVDNVRALSPNRGDRSYRQTSAKPRSQSRSVSSGKHSPNRAKLRDESCRTASEEPGVTRSGLVSKTMLQRTEKGKYATLHLLQRMELGAASIRKATNGRHWRAGSRESRNHPQNMGFGIDGDNPEETLSLTVAKTDFSKMTIVGQFNLGFIIAIRHAASGHGLGQGPSSEEQLFIIDQHASDEKYNFERLQASTVLQSQRLVHPKRLDLTALEEEIVKEHIGSLELNGFQVRIDESGSHVVGSRCELVALPLSRETTFSLSDLEELISLLGDDANSASGHTPRPSKVRKLFAMRACRSSIMIGKALARQQMETLVRHMGQLDKPWNCPHGRPTMRHLCGLQDWKSKEWQEGGVSRRRTTWAEYSSDRTE